MRFARSCWLLFLAAGCSRAQTSPVPPAVASEPAVSASVAPSPIEADAGASPTDDMPAVIVALFPESTERARAAVACPEKLHGERMRCLYDERYRGDHEAARIALDLAAKWNVLAGVERAHTMDGGYRGKIRLEPALPIAAERRQLEWIAAAFADIERVLAPFEHPDGGQASTKTYRWRSIVLRFVRSVGARTPSAYALDWTIGWNLAGSLHTSSDAVRETLVHEIFHLNDDAHGTSAQTWSQGALGSAYEAIVRKCGARTVCLAPYSPGDTMVRGGTYYAFQPGNDVREYAAELALRFFREHRAVARGEPLRRPFKCGPAENARAWTLLRDEFFGGVDLVPTCPALNR